MENLDMPKITKSKKSFKMPYVSAQMEKWRSAAIELESVAQTSFKNIRKYLPKYEAKLSTKDRVNLISNLSKFFFINRNLF